MITRIQIKNFQSLKDIELNAGRFTVITGSSSSGKSALIRAMKALANNIRGSDYVTRGEKKALIRAYFSGIDDLEDSVTLERGDGIGLYVLDPHELREASTDKYTKLNGSVPEDISRFLKIDVNLCFSQQFDSPYLLTESGAVVARALGALTNVDVVFSAAREGNKRRLSSNDKLKVRVSDLESLTKSAQNFRTLGADIELCTKAEEALKKVEALNVRIARLKDLLSRHAIASGVLSRTVISDLPDLSKVQSLYEQHESCRLSILQFTATLDRLKIADTAERKARAAEEELHQELRDLLLSAGTCPTCGSLVER